MQYRRRNQLRRNRLILLMLTISVVGLLLPTALTGRLMNLVQVLVPLQTGAGRVTDGIGESLPESAPPVSAAEHDRAVRETEALRRTVASLTARVGQLEQTNRQLTAIRNLGLGGRGMLIPARLVADDVLSWRDSGLLDAGTLRGVEPAAAVTSRLFTLDVGSESGARDGMAILAGEVLLGWVEHAGTHTARVKLLADPESRMPVSVGRFEGNEFGIVPAEFWLVGRGAGRMEVIDVDHRYVEGEPAQIAVGDRVISSLDNPQLPMPVTIGSITALAPQPENPLVYTLTVESDVRGAVRGVFVLGPPGS